MDFRKFKLQYDVIRDCKNLNTAIKKSCRMRNKYIAELLFEKFNSSSYGYFIQACEINDLDQVKFISSLSDFDANTYPIRAFQIACQAGQLITAQWLKTNWPNIDHRSKNKFGQLRHIYNFTDYVLLISCERKYNDQIKWLVSMYDDDTISIAIKICLEYNLDTIVLYIIDVYCIGELQINDKFQQRLNSLIEYHQSRVVLSKSAAKV